MSSLNTIIRVSSLKMLKLIYQSPKDMNSKLKLRCLLSYCFAYELPLLALLCKMTLLFADGILFSFFLCLYPRSKCFTEHPIADIAKSVTFANKERRKNKFKSKSSWVVSQLAWELPTHKKLSSV